MRLKTRNFIWLLIGLGVILPGGCSGTTVDLDSPSHSQMLVADRDVSGQGYAEQGRIIKLSLDDAIKRGFERNLDARVAALEALSQQDAVTLAQLKALPGIDLSGGYTGRSNPGASSSRSAATGQESLEPSISTEQHRRVASLEANWNLLDAALALADAAKADDEAKVAGERYAKVVQNVERDIYSAYWRALAYQDIRDQSKALMNNAARQIEKIDGAASDKLISSAEAGEKMSIISDRQRTLRDLHDRLQLAEIELKGMLSLPLDSKLILTTKRKDIEPDVRRMLGENISNQEWNALQSRPEMREEILKKNMTVRDTRREIFQTFPGIDLLVSNEYDSNKFLVDPSWSNFSAKIAQSITGLITLPSRYNAAKTKEAVADARRQALSSAILAQVHIARTRLGALNDVNTSMRLSQKAASRKSQALAGKKAQGMASGQDALLAQLESDIEKIRSGLAYAELQDAYAAMNTTLGRSISGIPVQQLAMAGGKR